MRRCMLLCVRVGVKVCGLRASLVETVEQVSYVVVFGRRGDHGSSAHVRVRAYNAHCIKRGLIYTDRMGGSSVHTRVPFIYASAKCKPRLEVMSLVCHDIAYAIHVAFLAEVCG